MSVDDKPPRSQRRPSASAVPVPKTVLVVDDDEDTRKLIVRWLSRAGLACVQASSGEQALQMALAQPHAFDAIVLDVMMPGLDGFETLARLKHAPATAHVPVALLTAHANEDVDVVRGVETGAVDHLAKPFSGPVLVAKVKALAERGRADRELRKKLSSAEANATIDALTGLYNRRGFESRLAEEAAHARRHQEPFAVLMVDIDHFKGVNDTFGHEEGDRVLVHVADAIKQSLRREDAAFRYGGEEFVLLLRAADAAAGARVSERLRETLKQRPIALGEAGEERRVTFSAGVAAVDASNAYDAKDVVGRADAALYRAKRAGRDRTEM